MRLKSVTPVKTNPATGIQENPKPRFIPPLSAA
jgi:hypothetical protein